MMKKTSATLMFLFMFDAISKELPKSMQGPWLNEKKNITIQLVEEDGKFDGKIIDAEDSVMAKSSIDGDLIGFSMFRDMALENNELTDGKIVHIINGKEYSCSMAMVSPDTLAITAGTKLFKRTLYWTRVSKQ